MTRFYDHTVSKKTIDFVLSLAGNISGIQLYVGEFDTLVSEYKLDRVGGQ